MADILTAPCAYSGTASGRACTVIERFPADITRDRTPPLATTASCAVLLSTSDTNGARLNTTGVSESDTATVNPAAGRTRTGAWSWRPTNIITARLWGTTKPNDWSPRDRNTPILCEKQSTPVKYVAGAYVTPPPQTLPDETVDPSVALRGAVCTVASDASPVPHVGVPASARDCGGPFSVKFMVLTAHSRARAPSRAPCGTPVDAPNTVGAATGSDAPKQFSSDTWTPSVKALRTLTGTGTSTKAAALAREACAARDDTRMSSVTASFMATTTRARPYGWSV